MIAQSIEEVIVQRVKEILEKREIPELKELVQTDSFAEIIEKLVILHIRMWMLEDKADVTTDRDELLSIEKKIDICFKQKRPKFVQAINLLVDNSIRTGVSLIEDSVKHYKGEESESNRNNNNSTSN